MKMYCPTKNPDCTIDDDGERCYHRGSHEKVGLCGNPCNENVEGREEIPGCQEFLPVHEADEILNEKDDMPNS